MKFKREDLVPAASSVLMPPGEMVRTLREFKGWSQLDLAEASGISQTNLSAIENGRVQLGKERSIALAEALSVHPSSIMFADYEEGAA